MAFSSNPTSALLWCGERYRHVLHALAIRWIFLSYYETFVFDVVWVGAHRWELPPVPFPLCSAAEKVAQTSPADAAPQPRLKDLPHRWLLAIVLLQIVDSIYFILRWFLRCLVEGKVFTSFDLPSILSRDNLCDSPSTLTDMKPHKKVPFPPPLLPISSQQLDLLTLDTLHNYCYPVIGVWYPPPCSPRWSHLVKSSSLEVEGRSHLSLERVISLCEGGEEKGV